MSLSPALSESLLVATWLAGVTVLAAVTGGLSSPALILLAVGPLVAWAFDRGLLVLESLVFATLALVLIAGGDFSGLLPGSLLDDRGAGWLGALSGVFVAVIGAGAVSLKRAPPPLSPPTPITEFAPRRPVEPSAERPPLAADGSVAVVDVTPLGHVRAIQGNPGLVPGLHIRANFPDVLAGQVGQALDGLLDAPRARTLALKDGRALALDVRPNVAGAQITLAAIPGDGPLSEAIDEALARQNAFYASLGHDLKTPLNAILGFADMMKGQILGPIPEAYEDYPALIHESGQDLLLLVDDILDLTKDEARSQRLELEPVDLTASGESVIRQMEAIAKRASVALKLNAPKEAWAQADPRAVRQIWQNLISNAIKYSKPGHIATLSTEAAPGQVSLAVADTGAGMSADDLARIGRPFEQGHNSRGRAGTGLGLTVVQRFAELQDGRVAIDTAPEKGTTVTVTLPAADEADLAPIETAAQ